MARAHRAPTALLLTAALAAVALAGCTAVDGSTQPPVREITFWVQEMPWEVHPGVTTTVWAFCAEGDGVEPVWDGPCGVPGPTVHVDADDLVRVTFRNDHTIPHTVHFHGTHPFSADMNGNGILGGEMVVQPGASYTFEWIADPAGTFIYHCHFDTPTHMDMGMYGVFIVDDPDEAGQDRRDFVAVLDEWSVGSDGVWDAGLPDYNYFTINGKSFPTTQAWAVQPGDHVRIHMVNAGYRFHAMHLHGYVPDAWEGVAGFRHAVPTDVREIAPGQAVVLDFEADREGVWLFHDHVVPHVMAGGQDGPGVYPRGMLTVLLVGDDAIAAATAVVPKLLEAAATDTDGHADHDHAAPAVPDGPAPAGPTETIRMTGFQYAEKELRVTAGTTITWTNEDPAYHTVTFDDGTVDSGAIQPGQQWSHTFDTPGTYDYYCKPHAGQDNDGTWQGMVGRVVVTPA